MSEHKEFLAKYGTPEHIDTLSRDKESSVRRASMANMTDSQKDRFLNDPSASVRAHLAKIGSDGHRDKLLDDDNEDVKASIAEHGNDAHKLHLAASIKSGRHHAILARKAAYGDDDNLGEQLLKNKHLSERGLEILAEKNSFAKKHYDKIINHPSVNGDTIYHLAWHSHGDDIDKIIDHPHNSDASMDHIVRNNKPSSEQMDKMLNSPKLGIETKKAISVKGDDSHRDRLLKDKDLAPVVMSNIALYGNHDHREQLLKHPLIKLGSTLRYIGYGSDALDPASDEHKEKAKRMMRGEE